jgi:hypothetical protein
MRSPHVYFHIYPQNQMKPALRGHLILVLGVPWGLRSPVVRDILDPAGNDFVGQPIMRLPALIRPDHHGIVYIGVNESAICDMMLGDPQMLPEDANYAVYNRQIVSNTRNFFLLDPNRGFKTMPQHLVQLL